MEFEDNEGQILIVKGKIYGTIWTLVGVYAPHRGKEFFLAT